MLNQVISRMKKNPTNHPSSGNQKKNWVDKSKHIVKTNLDNLRVLYEDNHIIAINKRPGDILQADKTKDPVLSSFAAQYIANKHNKPGEAFISIVHRIDRPVSGVVIFGRTSKATTRLSQMFKNREIQKTYWAIVENPPIETSGTVVNFLKKNADRNKSYVYHHETKDSKESQLSYRHVGSGDKYHYLEVEPKTGRHHQIRATLADIGCSIKGDVKYMAKRTNKDASVCLHARKIQFMHPVKKELITITAPPPSEPIWDEFLRISESE